MKSSLALIILPCILGGLSLVPAASGQDSVGITEFLADNDRGLLDEDGDSSDWIEIRNSGEAVVDLAGFSLTDDPAVLQKWVLPSEVLAPSETVVVFASGKDRAVVGDELHTNFGLDSDGGYLALVAPDGMEVLTEFVDYPKQRADVSYGLGGGLKEAKNVSDGSQWWWTSPFSAISGWGGLNFNPAAAGWRQGNSGIGYETSAGFESFIGDGGDTERFMFGRREGVYMRRFFGISSAEDVVEMTLRMRYDDGFVAYINGRKVAERNAPPSPVFDSLATIQHNDGLAIQWEDIDISEHIDALVNRSTNIIAIHGMNAELDSSDFLISAELETKSVDVAGGLKVGYLLAPTPGARNGESFEDFVKDTKFSIGRGFYTTPQSVAITTATEGATIRYTTDGTMPTAASGNLYSVPVPIRTTTILRAAAFLDGWAPTNVDTQTYVFAAQVVQQSEMDASIVNSPSYRNTIRTDLSTNLPALSMVVDDGEFFGPGGIYANPNSSGRAAEVPVSIEFFDPVGGGEFQVDGGVRIHGGNARSHPKKPMRLYFREEYGDRKLRYPLFEGIDVEEFDQLILRGGGHDSWSLAENFGTDSTDLPPHGTLMRDQFLRKTEREMGMLSPAGRYVHVYINGEYWGVYDLHERANADYFSSHLGGDSEDWDVMHHPEFLGQDHVVVDGDDVAWERLMTLVQRGVDSEAEYRAIADLLEIDDYIDHLIVRMWSGDYDWCGPIFQDGQPVEVFTNKNWYAGRQGRNGDSGGFRFFTWDAEMSMGLHLMVNRFFPQVPPQRVDDFDMTRANDFGSPVFPYSVLKDWPAFQRRFADRLHRHLFNDGIMSVENNRARLGAMQEELDSPMVGESARWGDEGGALFTRNGHWRSEVNWLRNTFIGRRNDILIDQFRSEGLYPDTEAPSFNQYGGEVAPGFQLEMSAPDGTIYYTTDGSDPYLPPVLTTTVLIDESTRVAALVPSPFNGGSTLGESWTEIADPANIGQWKFGTNGVGYDYPGEVNVDVGEMEDVNGSVFIRIPFTIGSQEELDDYDQLLLSLKYEDGFVVYLNGQEVDDDNAPAVLDWDSVATDNRGDGLAVVYETFDLSFELGQLQLGDNVLAIHALNDGIGSSDLLMTARLEAVVGDGTGGVAPAATEYTGEVVLDTTQEVSARVRSRFGEWSALVETTFLVGPLAGSENLRISEIHYRPLAPVSPEELAVGTSRSDYEFVELTNISDEAIDLTGVVFDAGLSWTFDSGATIRTLGAGERLLLVSNRDAFLVRYGGGLDGLITGEFRDGSKLANGGETLRLLAADGSLIHEVKYGDSDPWPVAADGSGPSLVLVDPAGAADPADVAAWAASLEVGGSPGSAGETAPRSETYAAWRVRVFDPLGADFEVVSAPDFDADGDGVLNVFEYISGRNPLVAEVGGGGVIEAFVTPEGQGITYTRVVGLTAPVVVVEASADLVTWVEVGGGATETVVENGDGTETVMVTLADNGEVVMGFRLKANVVL